MENNRYLDYWRSAMKKQTRLDDDIIREMEDHLNDAMEDLQRSGLNEEESCLIALKRLGNQSEIGNELSKIHTERLYKKMFQQNLSFHQQGPLKSIAAVVILAAAAGFSSRIPGLISGDLNFFEKSDTGFLYSAYYIIPFIAVLLGGLSMPNKKDIIKFLIPAAAGLVALLFFPFHDPGNSELIAAVHLSLLLWFILTPFTADKSENKFENSVHFLKFTGEFFIYTMLIYLGGGVLILISRSLFNAVGLEVDNIIFKFIAPIGFYAAPVVAAWLTEMKRNIIENIAPVLAKLFIPLFLLLLLIFLFSFFIQGSFVVEDRNFLILIDIVLLLVVAMCFYEISSREETEIPGVYDYLNFILIIIVILIDIIALGNILLRIGSEGFTINRTAAMAENILLAVNLTGICFHYISFFGGRTSFKALIRWQGSYMPVYTAWFAAATFILPAIFGFN